MIAVLLFVALFPTAADSQQLELPSELPVHNGVIGLRARTLAADSLIVDKILLHSPAHHAGIRRGDRLIAIGSYRVRTTDELARSIGSYSPGETLTLTFERNGRILQRQCTVTDIARLYYLMGEEGDRPSTSKRYPPAVTTDESTARTLVRRVSAAALDSLRDALVFATERYGHDNRLTAVDLALRAPLASGRIANNLIEDFSAATSLRDHLEVAALHLDLDLRIEDTASIRTGIPALISTWNTAAVNIDSAYVLLTPAERANLGPGAAHLLQRFGTTFYIDEGDSSETAAHIRTLRLAKKVDVVALFRGAIHLADFGDSDRLNLLSEQLHGLSPIPASALPQGLRGSFLYADSTALGWLLVGGIGPNFYGSGAGVIVDLGGNDTYLHRPSTPTTLIIDYQGDDRHIGGGAASGIAGIGLVLDLAGNDLYHSNSLALGAAFCGIGALWDHHGDDTYLGGLGGQGAAFFGAGLLIDNDGDDVYAAELLAQGFGSSGGLGVLRDLDGADRYFAGGRMPSTYGTPNTYAGWAQGAGCGFRGYGPGGIGLLIDGGGNDDYRGGDFAQGVGYFFGLGVLGDAGGNDDYRSSRYAQGAAAHQAIGVLIDRSGDDRYSAKIAASQGAGWDAAIGYLADWGGNDRYDAQHLSQGAAAMNGLGLLFDGDGADVYNAYSGQGFGDETAYWPLRQTSNLGVLIDRGGNQDIYRLRENEADARDAGIGIFSDR